MCVIGLGAIGAGVECVSSMEVRYCLVEILWNATDFLLEVK